MTRIVYLSLQPREGASVIMAFLFGGARPSPAETAKEFQRSLNSSLRGMDREVAKLRQQEKGLQSELARHAKEQKMEAATSTARELVRLRVHVRRVTKMKDGLGGLGRNLQSLQSSQRIQDVMLRTVVMMRGINGRCNPADVHRMLLEFEKQNSLLAAKQDITEEGMDNAFAVDDEEEETESAVTQVLCEAGFDTQTRVRAAPPVAASAGRAGDPVQQEADLEERLNNLRRV